MDPTTQAHVDSTPTASAHTTAKQNPTVTGLRQRVNSLSHQLDKATDHPAVQDLKKQANGQVAQFREYLGRSPTIVNLEKRLQVDRVILVVGGVLLYLLLVPLNILRLAQPITTLLTFVPPMLLSARVLDQPNEQRTRLLLSYYVVFGFVQFAESLMLGFLVRRIPQYYTAKLIFLAYLIHPRTKGALKFYQSILRPALSITQNKTFEHPGQTTTTPPTSKPATSSSNSPTMPSFGQSVPSVTGQGNAKPHSLASGGDSFTLPSGGGAGTGLEVPKHGSVGTGQSDLGFGSALNSSDAGVHSSPAGSGFVGEDGNVTKQEARGEGFSVISEAH